MTAFRNIIAILDRNDLVRSETFRWLAQDINYNSKNPALGTIKEMDSERAEIIELSKPEDPANKNETYLLRSNNFNIFKADVENLMQQDTNKPTRMFLFSGTRLPRERGLKKVKKQLADWKNDLGDKFKFVWALLTGDCTYATNETEKIKTCSIDKADVNVFHKPECDLKLGDFMFKALEALGIKGLEQNPFLKALMVKADFTKYSRLSGQAN